MSLEAQFLVFLISIAIGVGAAFLFDCYRAVRVNLRLGRVGTGIGDLVAWGALTLVVFGLLLLVNWGEVRWFILAGLCLGAAVYHRTMTRRGLAFWSRGFGLCGRVTRFLARPLVLAGRLLSQPFRLVFRPCHRFRCRLRRGVTRAPDETE